MEADALYSQQKYRDAIEKYKAAMRVFLGQQFVLPSVEFFNERYLTAGQLEIIELAMSAGNIAQSCTKLYEEGHDPEDLLSVIDFNLVYLTSFAHALHSADRLDRRNTNLIRMSQMFDASRCTWYVVGASYRDGLITHVV